MDERECLNLNIFTPNVSGSHPVFLWIHGGAFMHGAGSEPFYHGSHFARANNVVVVTVNYRLGCLGPQIVSRVSLIFYHPPQGFLRYQVAT